MNALTIVIIMSFIVVICILVEALHGTSVDPESGWCTASIYYKIAVILWIIACSTSMWIMLIMLSDHSEDPLGFKETYNSLKLCTIFLIILAGLNFLGILTFWWGRGIYTSVIAIMYTITVLCFVWYPLKQYFSLYEDQENYLGVQTYKRLTDKEKITIEDELEVYNWFMNALRMYARNSDTQAYYCSMLMDEGYSSIEAEKMSDIPEVTDNMTDKDYLKMFRFIVSHHEFTSAALYEESQSALQRSVPAWLTARTGDAFKTKLWPIKVIDLYLWLVMFRHEKENPQKQLDIAKSIVLQNFPLPAHTQAQFDDSVCKMLPLNCFSTLDIRTHTVPLTAQHAIELHNAVNMKMIPNMDRLFGFVCALIEYLWFEEFMGTLEAKTILAEKMTNHGLNEALTNLGVIDAKNISYSYKSEYVMSTSNDLASSEVIHVDSMMPSTDDGYGYGQNYFVNESL